MIETVRNQYHGHGAKVLVQNDPTQAPVEIHYALKKLSLLFCKIKGSSPNFTSNIRQIEAN